MAPGDGFEFEEGAEAPKPKPGVESAPEPIQEKIDSLKDAAKQAENFAKDAREPDAFDAAADYEEQETKSCCQGGSGYQSAEYVDLPEGRAIEALKDAFLSGTGTAGLEFSTHYIERMPFLITKEEGGAHVVRLDELLSVPHRQKGNIGGHVDPKSFVAHFNEQKNDRSRIFLNPEGATATAVFNENVDADNADWRDQRSTLVLKLSPEWVAWTKLINKEGGVSQEELGEFLEDYIKTIETEVQGALLETAKFFTAKKSVDVKTAITDVTGDIQLTFEETTTGAAKNGSQSFPSRFKIQLAVFKGGEVFSVQCTLRYKLVGQTIKFFPRIVNIDKVYDTAIEGIVNYIETETGTTTFLGTP